MFNENRLRKHNLIHVVVDNDVVLLGLYSATEHSSRPHCTSCGGYYDFSCFSA